jgi:hypothetical protein
VNAGDGPIIAATAHKHGIPDADILHAYANPTRVFALDDGLVMLIGATRSATLIEIGVVEGTEGTVVVHAMPARNTFLR